MEIAQKVHSKIIDFILITLAVISVFLFVFELTSSNISFQQVTILRMVDMGIASVFLLDFLFNLISARDTLSFWRRNWWQLFAAMPITTAGTQALRGLMFLRLLQILRVTSIGIRLQKSFVSFNHFARETRLFAIMAFFVAAVAMGTFSFYAYESSVNPMVDTYFDGLWFTINMITSAGSPDIAPATTAGRVTGMFLMLSGPVLLGIFTAYLVSYHIRK